MKKVFLLIAILTSYATYAQDATSGSKISVGFNFSSDYNYRSLRNIEIDNQQIPGSVKWEDHQIGKFGYTTGLTVSFKLSNRAEFETGLQYSNKGYQTKEVDLVFAGNPLVNAKGKFHYSYHYIGVPLKFNLFFGEGDLRIISGIGITANYLIKARNKSSIEYEDGKKIQTVRNTGNLYRIDLSPMISLGIDYKLSNTINLRAEPTFRYGILKTSDSRVKENLWSAGVKVGISFEL